MYVHVNELFNVHYIMQNRVENNNNLTQECLDSSQAY